MRTLKNTIMILIAMLCVFSSFMLKNNYTYAENLFFTLNTYNYESGTWTNENVNVEVVYNGVDNVEYQYSVNNQDTWQEFDGEIEFSQEGIYNVYFRLATLQSISMVQVVNIKLDKTNPIFNLISVSNFLPTSEDVVITIIASDGLSNVVGYKFGLSAWQEINTYNVTLNTTYEIGSILIKDGAGNITAYSENVNIANIDKCEPIFNLIANTQNTIRKDTITFQVPQIISGIDTFCVTMPNGKVIDITDTYANGFEVTQNGEYVFTLKSNSGLSSSVIINYNNISGIISNFELLLIICLFIILIIFGILFMPTIIKKIKLINKNKKNNKTAN